MTTIYTANLNEDTRYILVYDKTTPLDIIKLSFYYDPLNTCWTATYDKEGWVQMVGNVLIGYAEQTGLPVEDLSARPIKCQADWELPQAHTFEGG